MAALLLAMILFSSVLFARIATRMEKDPQEALCRASIRTHSKLLDLTADNYASELDCEPKRLTVKTNDEEKAKRQLADELVNCWDRWGRGDLVLFNGSGLYCNPCAFINFTGGKQIAGFDTYLTTTTMLDSEKTYAQYLLPSNSSEPMKVPSPGSSATVISFPTDQEAIILFVYAKGTSVQEIQKYFERDKIRSTEKIVGVAGGVGIAGGIIAGVVCTGTIVCGISVVAAVGIGAVAGATYEYFWGSTEKPEWISFVMLRPNDAAAFKALGCKFIQQKGPDGGLIKDV
jgi:hypothetical protein